MCCNDNPPTIHHETKPTARKPHRCCECGRTIEVGEKYTRTEGVWDGEFCTFKACSHCAAAAAILMSFGSKDCCICLTHSGLWENLIDYARGLEQMVLFRLSVARDRKWLHRRGPRKGRLMPVPAMPVAASTAA